MKRYLLICFMTTALSLTGFSAGAQIPISSPGSYVHTAVQQGQELANKTTNSAIQKETAKIQESTAGKALESSDKRDFEIKLVDLKTYEFARENLWRTKETKRQADENDQLIERLAPPKETYEAAMAHVNRVWFAQETSGGVSIQDMEAVKKQRQIFLQIIGAKVLAHATQLRKKIQTDTAAIKDLPESGANIVDDLFVQNTKLLALVQQQLVNTALQLEALEMTVARDILKETSDDKASTETVPLPVSPTDVLSGVLQ